MATDGGKNFRVLITTKPFERDVKRLSKRGKDMDRLWEVVERDRTMTLADGAVAY